MKTPYVCRLHPELDVLLEEMAAAKERVDELSFLMTQRLRDTVIQCQIRNGVTGCGAELRIGDLVYIQTRWYTQPHGCTEGDYWSNGEGRFECPACGLENRLYDRTAVEKLRDSFRSIVTRNDR